MVVHLTRYYISPERKRRKITDILGNVHLMGQSSSYLDNSVRGSDDIIKITPNSLFKTKDFAVFQFYSENKQLFYFLKSNSTFFLFLNHVFLDFKLFVNTCEGGCTLPQELSMTNEILLWENTEIFSVQVFVQMRGFKSVGSTSVKPQKALEPFYHLSYSILNP